MAVSLYYYLSFLCRDSIDVERRLDRVGCDIITFPAPETAAIADPIVIAQRAALLLEATAAPFSRFNVSGNIKLHRSTLSLW